MNLNFIKCFLVLADQLSFSKTAKILGVAQPSVSRQIRLLEEDLNVALFLRDRHQVRLTREGKQLRISLGPLIEGMEQALARSHKESSALSGPLHIGCLPEVGQHLIYHLILEFQEQHPELDFHVSYLQYAEVLELLKSGGVDFGVMIDVPVGESFRAYELFQERSVLVTRTGNKMALENLTELPFLGYTRTDRLLDGFLKTIDPKADISRLKRLSSVNSHKSMVEALLMRDCFAVLPYFTVQDLVEARKLRIASKKDSRSHIYLVQPDLGQPSRKSEVFRSYLIKSCKGTGP